MKFTWSSVKPWSTVKDAEWNNWSWQLRNSISQLAQFQRHLQLKAAEQEAFAQNKQHFKVRVTPYYLQLMAESEPIRRILMPRIDEWKTSSAQWNDPLAEREHSPVPRLVHRYPDRVLLWATDTCSVYCRYCTRKHFTGKDQAFISQDELDGAISYIERSPGVREVILSGGDPLTLSDSRLLNVVARVRAIDHVEIIRLGTRMVVVCPMRVTSDLLAQLKAFQPIYWMHHFNHPLELSQQAANALSLIADAGFPQMNQLVLLRGVNNHPAIIQALHRRLLFLRVKPYYMFQCDPSEGTDHLRTSIEESLEIQKQLWGRLSGLAMAPLSVDIPNGGGKAGLVPDFLQNREADGWSFKGWDGRAAKYMNPDVTFKSELPADFSIYDEEWREIIDQSYGNIS